MAAVTDSTPHGEAPSTREVPAGGEAPSPQPPAPPPAAPAGPSARPPLLVRAGLLGAFAVAVVAGVLRVNDRVRGLDDFQVDLSVAWISRAPAWLPESERKALAAGAAMAGKVSLHDEGLPGFVAGRLAAEPRVARVLGARRRFPDAVEVIVELRRPVAVVEAGGRLAGVDRDGLLVPGDYRQHPLPRIRGGGGDLPAPGKPFGRAVKEGASVADALPPELLLPLGLATLDVSGVEKGGPVLIQKRVAKGEPALTVEWGRAPASPEADLDPPAPAKVSRLRLAARRFPGLRGLKSVRLAFDDLVVVPL